MQDRLIPELELHGIKRMEDANRYLEEVYLPGHNEKFGVESREVESRFKPLPKGWI